MCTNFGGKILPQSLGKIWNDTKEPPFARIFQEIFRQDLRVESPCPNLFKGGGQMRRMVKRSQHNRRMRPEFLTYRSHQGLRRTTRRRAYYVRRWPMFARDAWVKKTFRVAPNMENPKRQQRAKKAPFWWRRVYNTSDISLPRPPIKARPDRMCSLPLALCRSHAAQQCVRPIT